MKIAVDIDDTLNVVDRAGRAGAYIARKNLPFRLQDEFASAFLKVFDWTYDDVCTFIREGGISAFTEAEARPGAREVLAAWKKAGHEVIIVTARFKEWFGNPAYVSRDWLEKRRIPYDEIAADIQDKGLYCAEHDIPVLVDDSPKNCTSAERRGVSAVLALGKHNAQFKNSFRSGANWKEIDAAVREIVQIRTLEELADYACPARRQETYDGWELRFDEWTACRGMHIRPAHPSRIPLQEKITVCEERYAAENAVCRFRTTSLDRELNAQLYARGYIEEKSTVCMALNKIPLSFFTAAPPPPYELRTVRDLAEWEEAFRAVTGERGVLRSYSSIQNKCVYAAVYCEKKPVAVGMACVDSGAAGLYDIRVQIEHRRKGVGTALCKALLGASMGAGASRAYLQAERDNVRAIMLYRALGFERVYDYQYLKRS